MRVFRADLVPDVYASAQSSGAVLRAPVNTDDDGCIEIVLTDADFAELSASTPLALRPYQRDGLAAVERVFAQGKRRVLVAWATGLGKTVLVAHLLNRRGGRALVLAHRDELLTQACEKLRLVLPAADVGLVQGDVDDHDRQVVVASVQTLARRDRLARLRHDFKTVVVDEAHHAEAESYQRILGTLGCFDTRGPLLLGVTATPERGDGKPLGKTFETIAHRVSILDGVRRGYLVDLVGLRIRLRADFSALRVRGGDFDEGDAERAMLNARAPEHVAEAIRRHAANRKTLVFTPTVRVAQEIAACAKRIGLPAEAIDGRQPLEERRAAVRRLRSGMTRVIVNCAILGEGFDEPSVDAVVIARPTKSRPLYIQNIGRGLRPYPGKANCLVLDCVGATARHDLVTLAQLFAHETGSEDALIGDRPRSVWEAVVEHERETASGRLVQTQVDLFARRPFAWIRTDHGFALSLGRFDGWLILAQVGEGWTVEHRHNGSVRVLWRGVDVGYAQGFAEDHARSLGKAVLLDKNAAWRSQLVSEAQARRLRKLGVRRLPTALTKGEAAEMISERLARRDLALR